MARNVAIILARGGSKAIPRKNIYPFCGKPLIGWSIEHAFSSSYVNNVYVSTDDAEIAQTASAFGARVIPRPSELAQDDTSAELSLLHALDRAEALEGVPIDYVLFLQATSPLRGEGDISSAFELLWQDNADSLFAGYRADDVCLWRNDAAEGWKTLNFDSSNRLSRQQLPPSVVENGSFYIFKPAILRAFKSRVAGKIAFFEMPKWRSIEIDGTDDISMAEYFVSRYGPGVESRR